MEMLYTTPDQERRYLDGGMWGDLTLFERFRKQAADSPEKPAIIDAKRTYSYGELARRVDHLASNFLGMGVAPGEVVAVQLPNWGETPLLHLALNRIGALCLPIHESWREMEVGHLLQKGGAVALVVPLNYKDFDYPAMVAGMRGELPALARIFSIGGAGPHSEAFEPLLDAVAVDAKALDARRPHPNAPGAIMLSSGTTALPKISIFSRS